MRRTSAKVALPSPTRSTKKASEGRAASRDLRADWAGGVSPGRGRAKVSVMTKPRGFDCPIQFFKSPKSPSAAAEFPPTSANKAMRSR